MARWEESAVTAQGEDMLNDLLFGRRLTVTGAYGGTGETDPTGLADLEDVAGERHKLALLDVENTLEGKTFGVQISNQGVETGFILHQIGIFARVDDGEEKLLCVFQDRDDPKTKKRGGIDVPSQAESPSFLLEFYGFLAITNGVRFEVDLSQSGATVTPQYLAQVMENHNRDEYAHPAIWAAVRALQGTVEEAGLPETGEAPPSPELPGKPGQHYFDRSDGGEWAEVCKGPGLSYTDSITKGWQAVAYRVRAFDDQGAYSDYTTSDSREVNNNTPPVIHCAATGDQGVKNSGFSISYTVTESLDGAERRTFLYADGPENFPVAGVDFLKLSNGPHRLVISATDGKGVSTHELTFQKLVTAASVTLAAPMEADAEISVCVLSVNGELPEDADFRVEVTNNGLDDDPVWEDCTTAVRAGMNYVFTNRSAQNGFAFNFRLQVERGRSGAGGFLTSIQGGFQ